MEVIRYRLPLIPFYKNLGRPMPDVVQTNAVLLSPDETGSANYRLTPAGPLFRRYATRSLEESRGLVPPYANGCDEVLSI
jgi:hypothetical protein